MNGGDDSPRTSLVLDGEWEFRLDPDHDGGTERWYSPGTVWPESRSVSLPHTWQEETGCGDYTGTAWYRRTVTVSEDTIGNGRRAFVRFEAADYRTRVWVNGVRIGNNRGGYLPFEMEATNALQSGTNTLVVAVTDPDDLSEIPHGKQGDPWYTRVSGIWQSITLELRPQTHVVSVEATPDLPSNGAFVTVDVDVGSGTSRREGGLRAAVSAFREGEEVAVDSIDISGDVSSEGNERSEAFLAFEDPDYWTPDTPVLYDLVVRLEYKYEYEHERERECEREYEHDDEPLDRYVDYFGMRSIDWNDGHIRLNGEPIRIRGVLDQGYYPNTYYRPPEKSVFEHEIATAKELGFNLIRKHLKPAHPAFLELADKMGLLVWEETANPTRFTERSRREVTTQLRDLIDRDYNRPSVAIWSVYNEEWGIGHHTTEETLWTDERKQTFLRSVVVSIRERDPTRLVCDNSGWAHGETDINDYHRYFVSPDRAEQWMNDLDHICHHPSDNYTTHDGEMHAPVMLTELGTWALPDLDRLRAQYSGTPAWFSHDFLTEPMKRPEGCDERFAETDLETVFGSMDRLTDCWQKRGMVSIKHLIAQIRKQETIAGFVLTELSDTEWEFNGILDSSRTKKSCYEEFASINQPIAVVADVAAHAVWGGETLAIDFYLINDTTTPHTGRLAWGVGTLDQQLSVTLEPNSVTHHSVSTRQMVCDAITTETVTAELITESQTISTTEPVTVVPPESGPVSTPLVYARGVLASRFAENGIDVTHHLSNDADIAFVVDITHPVEAFVDAGGVVVQYSDSNATMSATGPFSYRRLPRGESWNLTASLFYQDSPLFADLCPDERIGWAFEDAYPNEVAVDLESTDTVHAGYIEGWLANRGSPLVSRPIDDGTIIACAFQIRDSYGTHPAITTLVNRVIDHSILQDPHM